MGPWERARLAIAVLMCAICVALCAARTAELRAANARAYSPAPIMRTLDAPVVKYPQTRECALHGTAVTLSFGSELYTVQPTPDELRYGMRWSREP